MKLSSRQHIAHIVDHYQSTQTSGIKDIDKQLEIFTDDCILMTFSSAAPYRLFGHEYLYWEGRNPQMF